MNDMLHSQVETLTKWFYRRWHDAWMCIDVSEGIHGAMVHEEAKFHIPQNLHSPDQRLYCQM